jgi:serpin B
MTLTFAVRARTRGRLHAVGISLLLVSSIVGHGHEGGAFTVIAPGNQVETRAPRPSSFASDVCRELGRGGMNLVFSPQSASTSLQMALAGARGATEREIRQVLGLEAGAPPPGSSTPGGPGASGTAARLLVANSLWTEPGTRISAPFRQVLAESFHAEIRNAPFREKPRGAAQEINSWVAEATKGEIRELFPGGEGIDPTTRLLIANAVFFEAAWKYPFQKRATRSERFTIDEKHSLDVAMMHQTGRFPYGEDKLAQYLELPYDDARYALLLILPRAGIRLAEVEHSLFEALREKPAVALAGSAVRVAVPRFTIRSRLDLKQPLVRLGVRSAFVPGQADFSGMVESGARDLSITAILQEALIEVDEAGSRAAAATGLSIGITAAAPVTEFKTFRADRPFAMAILDRQDRVVLFAGRVVRPESS